MFDLHPKVKAALIAAVITGVVSVVAALKDAYPDNVYVGLASLAVPVLAGYLKSSGDTAEPEVPEDG